ncbi:MAG: HU family DNA-binding protein [Bacteroidales bacterium]
MKIKLVQRANPMKQDDKKYYANAINAGKKTIKDIARDIAGRSSLTRGDIENTLTNFLEELPKYLKDGFSLQMSDLGTFRLSLSSEGAESFEKFNTHSISAKVLFTPSVEMKRELSDIKYHIEKSNEEEVRGTRVKKKKSSEN